LRLYHKFLAINTCGTVPEYGFTKSFAVASNFRDPSRVATLRTSIRTNSKRDIVRSSPIRTGSQDGPAETYVETPAIHDVPIGAIVDGFPGE